MNGTIVKIFSDFHYVKVGDIVYECKLREVLKKAKTSVVVGDEVCLEELSSDTSQAAISGVLERKNFITRPSIANIDRVIVVAALKEPEFDYAQLNRYLIFAQMHNIPAVICVNKDDLDSGNSAREHIARIYSNLGYEIIFTSAKEKMGIDRLEQVLEDGISVLCGQSGVGKSSLLNAILPSLKLKTKKVSVKTERGTHTTRHSELIEVPLPNGKIATVADTPGFSHLRFDSVAPEQIGLLFDDIQKLAKGCKFNDCMHLQEEGCNVLENLDELEDFRYESYKIFVEEAIENKDKNNAQSSKKEEQIKISGGKKLVKIGTRARAKSRRTSRQSLNINSLKEAQDVHEDLF